MIEKLESAERPKNYEVLAVTDLKHRSGAKISVTVRFNWDVTAVGALFQYYSDVVELPFDMATETIPQLKAKALEAFNNLKGAPHSRADLLFALQKLVV